VVCGKRRLRPARLNRGPQALVSFMLVCQKLMEKKMEKDVQQDGQEKTPEAAGEYRGYRIEVEPIKDCSDLWDFEYTITSVDGGEPRARAKTVGGYATADVARFAGIEVARTEIDNLLAT
jgi:hypothetical protein